jgi:hypothetical protein
MFTTVDHDDMSHGCSFHLRTKMIELMCERCESRLGDLHVVIWGIEARSDAADPIRRRRLEGHLSFQ